MLLAVILVGVGYGINRLVKRMDGVGILIYVIVGFIILIIGVLVNNPKTAGLCAAGYAVGLYTSYKNLN